MRFILTMVAIISIPVLTLACSQTPPPATETATTGAIAAPEATRNSRPSTLDPIHRTPIPTLNPQQIEGTREAKVAEIKTQHAPTPTPFVISTVPPPIVIPTLAPPPIIPPTPLAIPTPVIITLPKPTPVTITVPTITVPTLAASTIVPPPPTGMPPEAARVAVPAQVREFAEVCGDLRSRDESAPDWTFRGWVAEAQAVEAPPELAEWWTAYVNQFALQTEDGPNELTQEASDEQRWFITQMSKAVQDTLMDAGCLDGYDVSLAYEVGYAWGRYEAGYGQGDNTSVEEFAQACADMMVTVPTLDTLDAMALHLLYWWAQLSPPPELADYYDAVFEYYRAWAATESNDPEEVPFEVEMAVVDTAEAMDEDVLETLLRTRCAG